MIKIIFHAIRGQIKIIIFLYTRGTPVQTGFRTFFSHILTSFNHKLPSKIVVKLSYHYFKTFEVEISLQNINNWRTNFKIWAKMCQNCSSYQNLPFLN